MRKFFKEYFTFSRREKNGIIVLAVILVVVIATRMYFAFSANGEKRDFSAYESEIDDFLVYQHYEFSDTSLFYFDPNTVSAEELLEMGLSPRSVNGILNYREKGYRFYKAEDLQRVRVLAEEEYEAIRNYVQIEKNYPQREFPHRKKAKIKDVEVELFVFDPNTASINDFERLGLKKWQAENIEKYRKNGGAFKKPADFAKIYGLDEDLVENLLPYIEIDQSRFKSETKRQEDISIELNTASDVELQKLRGIGPSFSQRIITYRDKLGGYYDVEQLHEVYGMTDELYESISGYFVIDTAKVKRINVNKADYKALINHPYIDKKIANAILNYRKYSKKITDMCDLVNQKAITKDEYDKIIRYISVQ